MVGLYRESLLDLRRTAKARLSRCENSLNSLVNQDSDYAAEHRQLIDLFTQVVSIYEDAPDELVRQTDKALK